MHDTKVLSLFVYQFMETLYITTYYFMLYAIYIIYFNCFITSWKCFTFKQNIENAWPASHDF